MKRIDKKVLIIGAGCSGLAVAANMKSDDYIIFEKENEIGGLCKTVKQDGFIWDYSGHFFHFATQKWKEYFESHIAADQILRIVKNTKIYYNGLWIDFPFQKNIHQLPKEEFIECLYDLFHREEAEKYGTFKEMLFGKFGRSISDKFLIPYNEKLYACDLDRLDSDAMGRFFPFASIKDIIDNMKNGRNTSYNDTFLYPKQGARVFVDALAESVKKENLVLNEAIVRVDADRRIAYSDHYEIHYQALVNTISFKHFYANILQKGDADCLSANKVLVLNLGFDKKSSIDHIHWAYFPDKQINFYRAGFYDNILNQKRLSMYIEIGFKEDEPICVDDQLHQTLDHLKKVGIITDHKLVSYHSCVMSPAYVHLSDASRQFVCTEKKKLAQNGIFSIGRYGSWVYCSIEDCLTEAETLVKENDW